MEELIRLPAQLSLIVDEAVDTFVTKHVKTQAYKRWHNADLWMIYKDEKARGVELAILTRRVTIGAWTGSGDEELVFIPDFVATKVSGGRYTPTPEQRRAGAQRLSVFNLTRRLLAQKDEKQLEREKKKIRNEMMGLIKSAWNIARKFSIRDTTELIP